MNCLICDRKLTLPTETDMCHQCLYEQKERGWADHKKGLIEAMRIIALPHYDPPVSVAYIPMRYR